MWTLYIVPAYNDVCYFARDSLTLPEISMVQVVCIIVASNALLTSKIPHSILW